VIRGTRPKKPSSSCGFAREARGARGYGGLKTENRIFFSLFLSFSAGNNYQKILKNKYFLFFIFFQMSMRKQTLPVRSDSNLRPHGAGGRGGRGEGKEGGSTSARTLGGVRADGFLPPWTVKTVHE
jgi:hypothetical protein